MNTFKKYCEDRDKEIAEGFMQDAGTWLGGKLGVGAEKAVAGAGRVANAAVSGIGTGVVQGAKRAWGSLKQGQDSNQSFNWGNQAQKAAASGDPDEFYRVAKVIHKEMKKAAIGHTGKMTL